MAYIHKKTFDIIQESNVAHYLDDYFEVADMIAIPVQLLNKKGYYTQASRYGSPFDIVNEWFSNERIPEDTANNNYLKSHGAVEAFEYELMGNPKYKYKVIRRDKPIHAGYIRFLPGVVPSDIAEEFDLPDGFDLDEDLGYEIQNHTPQYAIFWGVSDDYETPVYDFFEEAISDMRALYDWALALPDLTKCVQ